VPHDHLNRCAETWVQCWALTLFRVCGDGQNNVLSRKCLSLRSLACPLRTTAESPSSARTGPMQPRIRRPGLLVTTSPAPHSLNAFTPRTCDCANFGIPRLPCCTRTSLKPLPDRSCVDVIVAAHTFAGAQRPRPGAPGRACHQDDRALRSKELRRVSLGTRRERFLRATLANRDALVTRVSSGAESLRFRRDVELRTSDGLWPHQRHAFWPDPSSKLVAPAQVPRDLRP